MSSSHVWIDLVHCKSWKLMQWKSWAIAMKSSLKTLWTSATIPSISRTMLLVYVKSKASYFSKFSHCRYFKLLEDCKLWTLPIKLPLSFFSLSISSFIVSFVFISPLIIISALFIMSCAFSILERKREACVVFRAVTIFALLISSSSDYFVSNQ